MRVSALITKPFQVIFHAGQFATNGDHLRSGSNEEGRVSALHSQSSAARIVEDHYMDCIAGRK